ncbi:PRC-barrel domain protein [Methylobacterium sp. 4-46]|uniref:PRC-barrel domain-containing protein n=1 Tax=unclassified Methylobacterium TaxID=2615210 RepID=UPI000152CA0A|nr:MULTISPECIES: PRC-barrel domain-containing protein [Methylobacterium]ACA20801.1 PRC-barrel domain protein [Methylobacterium sp. 4-46]WFT79957.1 PRC-barrel domain-containing protein [Methylobacterium nodulans]
MPRLALAAALLVAGALCAAAQDAKTPSPADQPPPAPASAAPAREPTAVPAAPATLDNALRPTFVAQQPDEMVASKLIGLSIRNRADETIGSVADLVLAPDLSVKSYVVGVGGFLGIGTKYVSIARSAVEISRVDDTTLKAVIDTDRDQLRAAPEYVYLAKADARKGEAKP